MREVNAVVIIETVPHASVTEKVSLEWYSLTNGVKRIFLAARRERGFERGQVAQVVERSPEKAGVGGSTPSLATMFSVAYPRS